ncbi:MAG: helix-turn-helix transcriptional regulator [Eggerthellaceae bacterium]|nr:helix-turn-helix transcriptional regulator [Eggerthellaceae bacterium]
MDREFIFMASGGQTKLRIIRTIDRPIDTVSVSEICERAGISRATFYKHFKSKYDISAWYSRQSEVRFLNEIGRSLSWREAYVRHFSCLEFERNLFMYSSAGKWTPYGIDEVARSRATTILKTLEMRGVLVKTDESWRFIVKAYAYLEIKMASDWFKAGMGDPERFSALLEECVPARLHEALTLPCDFAPQVIRAEGKMREEPR